MKRKDLSEMMIFKAYVMRWDQIGNNLEIQFPGRNNNLEKGPKGKILVFLKNSENDSQDGP